MTSTSQSLAELRRWALESEGSTRPLAWIRMGMAFLIWTRFAPDLTLQYRTSPEWIALVALFHVGAFALFVGLLTPVAGVLVAAVLHVMVYGFGVGGLQPAWDHHYSRFLCAVMLPLSLAPLGRSYSLDRMWATRRRSGAPPERHNLWALRLVSFQVAAVYFWAAFDKCNFGFLSGARLIQIAMVTALGSASLQNDAVAQTVGIVTSWLTVLVEYFLAFGLFFRRTRWVAVALGVLFHVLLAVALPVGAFSAVMLLLYLAFFDPDDVQAALERSA